MTSPYPPTRTITEPVTLTYAATITPNAALGALFRIVATGDPTINDPIGGADGQWLRIEVTASGASRVITLTGISGTFAVPSGGKTAFDLIFDGTDWWLDL